MKWKGRFELDCESLKSEPSNPRVHPSADGIDKQNMLDTYSGILFSL